MYKHFATMLVLLVGSAAQATTINPLFNNHDNIKYHAVAVLNDQLLYEKEVGDIEELWVYDPATDSNQKLLTLRESFVYDERKYQVHDHAIYFINQGGGSTGSGVWRTDLTPAGTVELSGTYTNGHFTISNGLLFNTTWDSSSGSLLTQLVRIDETGVIPYDLHVLNQHHKNEYVCAFDDQHMVVITTNDDFGNVLNRYQDGTVTQLAQLSPNYLGMQVNSMFYHDGNCFIAVKDRYESTETEVFRVSQSGTVIKYNDIPEFAVARTQRFLLINGRVIASGYPGFYRFASDYQSFDLVHEGGSSWYSSARVFQDHIIAVTTVNADPPPTFMSFFNEQLQPQDGSQIIGNNHYFLTPEVHPMAMNDLVLIAKDRSGQVQDLLISPEDVNETGVIKNREIRVSEVIADEGSFIAYLNASDSATQVNGIYAVDENPVIGQQANGPWIDPTRDRQGVVISKGLRSNGSEYLFVTIYTYRNGEPLWLAGNANLGPNQKSLSMPVFEYSGIGLFEQYNLPDQEPFGVISLSFVGCDSISAEVEFDNEVVDLNLTRVDDVTFVDLCVD